MAIDLNRLRQVVHDNQKNSQTTPAEPAKQVVVDRAGNIHMRNELRTGEQVTEVQQDTFAGFRGHDE